MSATPREVTFFFGLGSRYSYLASTQIATLERDGGCCVTWRPMMSQVLMERRGRNPFAALDSQGNWSGAVMSDTYTEVYRRCDLVRWALYYGVRYREPPAPIMDAGRRTLYCVAAAQAGVGARYALAMFNLIYVEGRAVTEEDCRALARSMGVDLTAAVDDGSAALAHEETIATAAAAGVFGVPTFLFENQVYFGNDRIVLLKRALRAR